VTREIRHSLALARLAVGCQEPLYLLNVRLQPERTNAQHQWLLDTFVQIEEAHDWPEHTILRIRP